MEINKDLEAKWSDVSSFGSVDLEQPFGSIRSSERFAMKENESFHVGEFRDELPGLAISVGWISSEQMSEYAHESKSMRSLNNFSKS